MTLTLEVKYLINQSVILLQISPLKIRQLSANLSEGLTIHIYQFLKSLEQPFRI